MKWQQLLRRVLSMVKFLARQNLAFRGHREELSAPQGEPDASRTNRGNFLELAYFLAEYDSVMLNHLQMVSTSKKISVSYLSKRIQNEFINILGDCVRRKIIDQVKKSEYYAIMFDSTPDSSHQEKTSQVLRYVVLEGEKVTIEESFICFLPTKGKTADAMSKILDKLRKDGLDIGDCRAQAYDNANVMAGKKRVFNKRSKKSIRERDLLLVPIIRSI